MLTLEQLQRAAASQGFSVDSLEKVWMLVRLLNMMVVHPFMRPRVALKGGTALNLFLFDVPRLSVDIDVNYVGAPDRTTMMAERPKLDTALQQIVGRLGLTVKRAPAEHAGGKWRLSYTSALGRPAILEVDVNYMRRVPLWDPTPRDSRKFLGEQARQIPSLDSHELAAGKLAALLARGASRDLFDARQLLSSDSLDSARLRLAFVVYGGINRIDWRTVSAETVTTTATDVTRQLLPSEWMWAIAEREARFVLPGLAPIAGRPPSRPRSRPSMPPRSKIPGPIELARLNRYPTAAPRPSC